MWWRQDEAQCSWWTFPAGSEFSVGYFCKLYPLSKLKFVSVSKTSSQIKKIEKKGKLSGVSRYNLSFKWQISCLKVVGGVSNRNRSSSKKPFIKKQSLWNPIKFLFRIVQQSDKLDCETKAKLAFSFVVREDKKKQLISLFLTSQKFYIVCDKVSVCDVHRSTFFQRINAKNVANLQSENTP